MNLYYHKMGIGEAEALSRLKDVDWRNAAVIDDDSVSARRIWLPFEYKKRRNLVSHENGEILTKVPWPLKTKRKHIKEEMSEPNGLYVNADTESEKVVYFPFWEISESGRRTAIVDCSSGEPVTGSVKANKTSAIERFFAVLVLWIMVVLVSALLFYGYLGWPLAIFVRKAFYSKEGILISLAGGSFFTMLLYRYHYKVFNRVVTEPVFRVIHNRIILPVPYHEHNLAAAACMWTLLVMPFAYIWHQEGLSEWNLMVVVPFIAFLVACVFLFSSAIKFSKPSSVRKIALPESAYTLSNDRDDFDENTRLIGCVTVYTLMWGMLGKMLVISGISSSMPDFLPQLSDSHWLYSQATAFGSFYAVLIFKFQWRLKIVVVAVTLADLIGGYFLTGLYGYAFLIVTLFVTAFATVFKGKCSINAFLSALYVTWFYGIAGTIGALVGSFACFFFGGVDGIDLGVDLGESIGGIIGIVYSWSKLSKEE